MIGGKQGDNRYSDKVWKYKKNGEWEEMAHLQLDEKKEYVAAMIVPSSIFHSYSSSTSASPLGGKDTYLFEFIFPSRGFFNLMLCCS